MNKLVVCLALVCLLAPACGYPYFRDQIPNGWNVPHPCLPNTTWNGVGHLNYLGGGDRNVFGLAFKAAGFTWTRDLCLQDTDQDGMTNGQELGDPSCNWTVGMVSSKTTNISHPGICDPYNSQSCAPKNSFVTCAATGIDTCAVINNPNTSFVDLRFTQTNVPNSETNYYCMTFDLPADQDYHIVASKPLIDNVNVVHHMLLFGCENISDANDPVPTSCGMSANGKCSSIISAWTVGVTGSCYGDKVGFRIGKTGFIRVRLQLHYNNPGLVQDYTDSSGMRIYYKPIQPGTQDLVMLMTGQLLLELPPRQSRTEIVGVCPSSCTRQILTRPVNVTTAFNHMHYLGTSMTVEVFRDGQKVATLTDDEHYSYDSPVTHIMNPEFELLPGDDIKTSCVYNTVSKSTYTYWGEGTSDEMCFGFIIMYPREAVLMDSCSSVGSYSMCDIQAGKPIGQCNWVQFINLNNPDTAKILYNVTRNCNLDGFCRPECRTVLADLQGHPCLQGDANEWVTKMLLSRTPAHLNFLALLRSCPMNSTCESHCTNCGDNGLNGADGVALFSVAVMFMAASVWFV